MTLTILATATESGFAAALVEPIKELRQRGHSVAVYATGTEQEAKGFGNLEYNRIQPSAPNYSQLVTPAYDCLLVGLSGQGTPDAYCVQAANDQGIPSIAVNMQDGNYLRKLGEREDNLPTIIAQMSDQCLETVRKQVPGSAGKEAVARSRVVGWTMFDHYAALRESYTSQHTVDLRDHLKKQDIELEERISVYLTQHFPTPNDASWVPYEKCVTEAVFAAAHDLGLRLAVKPHPREDQSYIEKQTKRFSHIFIPFSACKTQNLILAADAVFAGRSTALTESCLLDRNTGGILPHVEDLTPYPAVTSNAIIYAQTLNAVKDIIDVVAVQDMHRPSLAQMRKRFSVDGKASQRLADIIEELGGK